MRISNFRTAADQLVRLVPLLGYLDWLDPLASNEWGGRRSLKTRLYLYDYTIPVVVSLGS